MYANPYASGSSLETQVLSATPTELIGLLFDAAVKTVVEARRHLAEGRIPERGRAVTKTVEIMAELSRSLNHTEGGELSARLAGVYDYVARRVMEANFEQTDGGLAEAERLLRTVQEGWTSAMAGLTAAASATPAAEYAGAHQWSA